MPVWERFDNIEKIVGSRNRATMYYESSFTYRPIAQVSHTAM